MVLSGIHKALILQELDSRLNTSGMTFGLLQEAHKSKIVRESPWQEEVFLSVYVAILKGNQFYCICKWRDIYLEY